MDSSILVAAQEGVYQYSGALDTALNGAPAGAGRAQTKELVLAVADAYGVEVYTAKKPEKEGCWLFC